MSEKFFIVTDRSGLREEYFQWKNNRVQMIEIAKNFMDENNIETSKYANDSKTFYIVPSSNDIIKFGDSLCKEELHSGLRKFKKTSSVGKAWIALLKEKQITPRYKPFVGIYFKNTFGKHSSRLFDIDNVIYCSFSGEFEIDTPEGFEEIKASEFYKVIEDYESKEEA